MVFVKSSGLILTGPCTCMRTFHSVYVIIACESVPVFKKFLVTAADAFAPTSQLSFNKEGLHIRFMMDGK